jgi:predicted phage terminase large subunit-like protein
MTKLDNSFDVLGNKQLSILKYSNDPVRFTKEIIGLECESFHQEWLHAFEDNKFTVLLAPRGHGKTSIAGSYIVWKIARDRNIRALIVTINQDKANDMMSFVQSCLTSNPKLISLFGDFKGNAEWSRSQIRVRQTGSRIVPLKDATLKVIGQGSRIISGHYDLIVLDDVTDDDNSKTETRRKDLEDWYNGPLVGTFLAHTQVIDIGTRWHESDFHEYLMTKAGFKTLKYQALIKEPDERGNGAKVLWPKHLPWDDTMIKEYDLPDNTLTLKFIREHQGELFFQMQYQNDIIASSIAKFKAEWVDNSTDKFRKLGGLIPLDLKRFIGVDFGGDDSTSDWGVSTVIGIDTRGDIYVLDSIRTHSTLNRQIDIMKALDSKYHASRIGMDAAAQQKIMVSDAKKQYPNLPIIAIKPSKVNDRDTRTDRLSLLFETGRIIMNPSLTNLIDELRLYPRSKHDDCIDSLSFAIETSQEGGNIDWNAVANVIATKRQYDMFKV